MSYGVDTTMTARLGKQASSRTANVLFQSALMTTFAITFLLLSLLIPNFFTLENQFNILRQAAPILIAAVGMTLVITTAGIDLSVGSGLALAAVLSAAMLDGAWSPWSTMLAVSAFGALVGGVNGYFVAYQRIPAFIATLASLSVLRGLAQLITKGYSIPIDPGSAFLALGRGRLLGVPVPVLVAIGAFAGGYLALYHTRFGVYVSGIGSNEEAVRRAGVSVRKVTLVVYTLSGLAFAIAGMITAARLASGSSYSGVGFELQVIAAVVVGGTSLFGGDGRIAGTVVGALLLASIENGLILMDVSPFYLQIIGGAIILLAIWVNLRLADRRDPR